MGFVDAMETPLDVLSRAATLIHDQLKSDGDDDSNQVRRELIGYEDEEEEEEEEREDGGWNSTASKQLPTRAKKERRRHERHCDLISTASRNSRTHRKQAEAAAAAAAAADRIPQRREIISSGMSDPVIDEHFRRSLGERYTHLFASTSPAPTSSMTAADSSCSNPSRDDKLP